VHDQFDVSLQDSDLMGEVELTTNLIIAASETDEHLTAAEIDEILGVVPGKSACARYAGSSAGREEHGSGTQVRQHRGVGSGVEPHHDE